MWRSFGGLRPALLAIGLACTATPKPAIEPAALGITVRVEQHEVGGAWHPVAKLAIQNLSSQPVAFTRTFGITNNPWVSFSIETADGSRIYYPSEVDVFQKSPEYICLRPSETLAWDIDLLSWHVLFGGESWEGPFAFDLQPGHYRLQALYTDEPGRVRASCPGLNGTSSSNWVEFTVRPE